LTLLEVKFRPFPLTLHVGLTTVQRYRAACDCGMLILSIENFFMLLVSA